LRNVAPLFAALFGGAMTSFSDAMQSAGLNPPESIIADGNIHRFSSNGKRGDEAGWFVLFNDGIPAGSFGDWRTGFSQTWRADMGRKLTDAETKAHRERVEAMRKQREAEEIKGHEDAAIKAAEILKAAQPAPTNFPYLVKKGIKPNSAKFHDGLLVLPMRDTSSKLWNVERISPDGGNKKGLFQGKRTGCYFSIGSIKNAPCLCIAEGFATGASIHEATGYPVAVTFNAGNLGPVAKAMRDKFPNLPLILCADDDYLTEGNPGLTKATEAARRVGGLLAMPDFGADRPEKATDFNDMHQHCGLEAVERAIASATASARCEHQPDKENAPEPGHASHRADDEVIARLASMKPLEYDRVRKDQAEILGVRPGTLDKLVAMARKADSVDTMDMVDVEPWPDTISPASLLTELSETVRRFIVCESETADAVALWVAMTWFMDVVQVAPLAVITAPEKRCGKSQLLFLLGRLSYRPLTASSISPAAMFRAVDAWKPTLLVDEADAFMRDNGELRGIINAGHTRDSAYVVRVVGEDLRPQRFSVWGAKALAGIGHLADTLMDRAIVLELRRKLQHEKVDRLRYVESDLFQVLSEKLARFAEDCREAVRHARPTLPASLNDRAQDNWEPLLAIADVAGDCWPELARRAALKLSGTDGPTMTVGTELLADIQEIFDTKRVDRISTADLIAALTEDDEKPWNTYNRGKPITPRQVARKLSEYSIKSATIRIAYGTAKGYARSWFEEAFSRYLTSPPAASVTTSQINNEAASRVTDKNFVTVTQNEKVTLEPTPILDCYAVTDKTTQTAEVEI